MPTTVILHQNIIKTVTADEGIHTPSGCIPTIPWRRMELSPATFPYRPHRCKLTYLWENMHKHGIQLKSDQFFWVPTSQYENNVAIMDAIRAKQEEYRGTS